MKILLADDSLTIRRVNLSMLRELGYSEFVEADCGEEVLARLEEHPDIDMILLDWNMPLMNGLDCLKAIKANPGTKHIPVVMVTSEATKSRILEAIQCGANQYLLKPYDIGKLKTVIEAVQK